MSCVYDTPILELPRDPAIDGVNEFVSRIARAVHPGAHLVEFFPWMIHLPRWAAKWKRDAQDWFQHDTKMFEGMFSAVEERVVSQPIPERCEFVESSNRHPSSLMVTSGQACALSLLRRRRTL